MSDIADQLVAISEAAGSPEGFFDDSDGHLLAQLQRRLADLGGEGVKDRAALLDAFYDRAVAEAKRRLSQKRHS